MCGCVEHMPVVSRSDCTQTNVKESYTFLGDSNNVGATIDRITVQFQACQGANNNNNDLEAFVQQLVNDGKLSTTEQNIFKTRIVGNNNCDDATSALLADSGFEKGFEIDSNDWTFMVGEGSRFAYEEPILHDALVKEMLEAQDISIVRRVCPTCVATHKDIYYRRLTPIPEGLNLLETLKNKWIEDNGNKFNEDFALYSSYMDAYFDMNRWTFCNFASDVGFPRDCCPTGYVPHQWNSYVRNGGTNGHAFMIPADPDFESEIEYEKFLTIKGTDYVEQKGTQVATGSNYEGLVGMMQVIILPMVQLTLESLERQRVLFSNTTKVMMVELWKSGLMVPMDKSLLNLAQEAHLDGDGIKSAKPLLELTMLKEFTTSALLENKEVEY